MREKKQNESRRLLKTFGVAVTDFEREGEEVLERVRSAGKEPVAELVAELRELLELIADCNAKWQKVTDHIFDTQRRLIADVMQALPR